MYNNNILLSLIYWYIVIEVVVIVVEIPCRYITRYKNIHMGGDEKEEVDSYCMILSEDIILEIDVRSNRSTSMEN
jgi:choline-glycine betaine transporter